MTLLARWLARGLLALIGLAVMARGGLFLAYVYYQGRTPFDAFHLEAKMVWMAWRAAEGLSMYPPWDDLPNYEPNFFGPLYFLVVGWIGRATGADLDGLTRIGRGVTVGAGLVAAGLVAWAAGKRYGKAAGFMAGVSTLGPVPMSGFGVMARPDLLADTLGFAGFLAATAATTRRRWLIVGGLLLAASGLTKQTCAFYFVAAVVALFVTGRRRAALELGGGVGLGVGLVVGLGVLTWEPRLLVDLLGEVKTPSSGSAWADDLLWRLWVLGPEMIALWVLGLALWLARAERDYALATLNVVLVGSALATSTKLGADLNYFIGPRLVAAMALGAVWHATSRIYEAGRGGGAWNWAARVGWLAVLGTLLVAQKGGLSNMAAQWEVHRDVDRMLATPQGKALLREHRQLFAMASDAGIPLLTDDGLTALRQRERAPFVDPWLFRMRVMTGRMRAEAMEKEIGRGAYRYIITRHDLMAPTYDTYDFGLPPALAAIARKRYRLAGTLAGRYIYEPVESAR